MNLRLIFNLLNVVGSYGKELEANGSYSEIFKCYESALKLFPNNEILFNNFGSHLIR